jgi:predicted ABC-type ATPase
MAKPEAENRNDKPQKPSEPSQKAGPFSGADHPLAQKDAQKILKANDGHLAKQEPNAFEQFLQKAQKVTQAAQDAVGTAVDTTKKIAHDVTQTIQSGGDLGKQIEKSADTVVAKALEEKSKIDKAAGRSEEQTKAENKFANALYEAKKHDAQEAYSAASTFIDKGTKSQGDVVKAATQKGDVAHAIEKHTDIILDGLLESKMQIDKLIGRNPASSYNENLKLSLAYGASKSLVKGAVGIVSLADRPKDQDIQILNKVSPQAGASLAIARNIGDALGGAWNAGSKYIDHVNKVGMQEAGNEAMQSAQKWSMNAKPYDWAEKATDIGMLATGGIGLAKTGLSVLGKVRMVQQGVTATEALAGSAKAGATMETAAAETALAETAGAVKTEVVATTQVESAAAKVHPKETVATTQAESAATEVHSKETAVTTQSESATAKVHPKETAATTQSESAAMKADESAEALKKGDQSVGKVVDDPFRGEFTKEEIQMIQIEAKRQSTAPMVKKASKIAEGENAVPIKDSEIKAAKKRYWDEQHAKPITKGHPPVLDIVVGAPGSGKTANIVGPLTESNGSFLVEADDMRPLLPGYKATDGGLALSETGNQFVGTMASDLMSKAMLEGENVVWATVGKSPEILERAIAAAKEKGYTVRFHLADISPNEAGRRCFQRAFGHEGSGQWVDPRYAIQCAEQVPKVFNDLLKSGRFDPSSFFRYDMHVPKGSLPKPLPIEGMKLKGAA